MDENDSEGSSLENLSLDDDSVESIRKTIGSNNENEVTFEQVNILEETKPENNLSNKSNEKTTSNEMKNTSSFDSDTRNILKGFIQRSSSIHNRTSLNKTKKENEVINIKEEDKIISRLNLSSNLDTKEIKENIPVEGYRKSADDTKLKGSNILVDNFQEDKNNEEICPSEVITSGNNSNIQSNDINREANDSLYSSMKLQRKKSVAHIFFKKAKELTASDNKTYPIIGNDKFPGNHDINSEGKLTGKKSDNSDDILTISIKEKSPTMNENTLENKNYINTNNNDINNIQSKENNYPSNLNRDSQMNQDKIFDETKTNKTNINLEQINESLSESLMNITTQDTNKTILSSSLMKRFSGIVKRLTSEGSSKDKLDGHYSEGNSIIYKKRDSSDSNSFNNSKLYSTLHINKEKPAEHQSSRMESKLSHVRFKDRPIIIDYDRSILGESATNHNDDEEEIKANQSEDENSFEEGNSFGSFDDEDLNDIIDLDEDVDCKDESFLKEMLIETNRRYIKDKQTNEEKIKDTTSILIFDILHLKLKSIKMFAFLKIQAYHKLDSRKLSLICMLNCFKNFCYRKKKQLNFYFMRYKKNAESLKYNERKNMMAKFQKVVEVLDIENEIRIFHEKEDIIRAICLKLNEYENKNKKMMADNINNFDDKPIINTGRMLKDSNISIISQVNTIFISKEINVQSRLPGMHKDNITDSKHKTALFNNESSSPLLSTMCSVPLSIIPPVPVSNIPQVPPTIIPPVPISNIPQVPLSIIPPVPVSNIPQVPTGNIPLVPMGNIPNIPMIPLISVNKSETPSISGNISNIPGTIPNIPGIPSIPSNISNIPGIPSISSKIPNIPGIPSIPSNIPNIPGNIPNIPGIRSIPGNIPNIPGIPSIPGNIPNIPGIPSTPGNIPNVPGIPSTPGNIPNVPGIPSIPGNIPNVPGIPSIPGNIPNIPGIPSIPGKLPSFPGIPSIPGIIPNIPGIPSILGKLPSLPGIPSLPGKLPNIPGGFPQIPGMAQPPNIQQIPAIVQPKPPKDTNPKKIFWNMIPKNKIQNTFWMLQKLDAKIDYDNLCKLFCEPKKNEEDKKSKVDPKASNNQDTIKAVVKLLDDKRLMNLGIALAKVNFTNEELKIILENFQEEKLTIDMIDKIVSLAPNAEEIEKLKTYTGDTSLISNGERFCLTLISVHKFMNKLEFIKFKKMMNDEKNEIIKKLKILKEALQSIRSSVSFQSVLKMILKIGNYLNADSAKGNAQGVAINTLNMLDSIKGVGKEKNTLLDFVVMNIRSQESSLINFSKDFVFFEDVLQIDLADVESKIKEFENGIKKIMKESELIEKENSALNESFLNFLKDLNINASQKLSEIKGYHETFSKELNDTAIYFGEDPKLIKIFDFVKLINDFVNNFNIRLTKISVEEAKQLKKQIKEEKNKNPDNKTKYKKDLDNIKQTVTRKTEARKTALKSFHENKKEKLMDVTKIDDNSILGDISMVLNQEKLEKSKKILIEAKIEEKSPVNIRKIPVSILKNSIKNENSNLNTPSNTNSIPETKSKLNNSKISQARITKFKKNNTKEPDSEDEMDDSCDYSVDNDYLMINQPLKINKLLHLNNQHKRLFNRAELKDDHFDFTSENSNFSSNNKDSTRIKDIN